MKILATFVIALAAVRTASAPACPAPHDAAAGRQDAEPVSIEIPLQGLTAG